MDPLISEAARALMVGDILGALNRVDLDDRYDEVRSAARVGMPA